MNTISIDDFKKLDIRVGRIVTAERVPDTDKLLRLSVEMGEEEPRQIVSGIADYFPNPETLVGKQCAFAANLEPRVIRGFESRGMILAVSGQKEKREGLTGESGETFFSLLEVGQDVPPGVSVR